MSLDAPDPTTAQAQSLARSTLAVVGASLGEETIEALLAIATGDNSTTIAIEDISVFAVGILRGALSLLAPEDVRAACAAAWRKAEATIDADEDTKFPKGSD